MDIFRRMCGNALRLCKFCWIESTFLRPGSQPRGLAPRSRRKQPAERNGDLRSQTVQFHPSLTAYQLNYPGQQLAFSEL